MDIKDIIKWLIHCLLIYSGSGCNFFLSHKTKSVSLRKSIFLFFIILICVTKVSSQFVSQNILSHSEVGEVLKNNDGIKVLNKNTSLYLKKDSFLNGRALKLKSISKVEKKSVVVKDPGLWQFLSDIWHGFVEDDVDKKVLKEKLIISARTFARPWKKMAMMLIPLVFHSGATSMWIAVSSIGMVKLFLMLLVNAVATSVSLIAGFRRGQNTSDHIGVDGRPISVHIHNQLPEHHTTHEHTAPAYYHDPPPIYGPPSYHSSPYQRLAYHDNDSGTAPHTINTPYGQYVKVGPPSK